MYDSFEGLKASNNSLAKMYHIIIFGITNTVQLCAIEKLLKLPDVQITSISEICKWDCKWDSYNITFEVKIY